MGTVNSVGTSALGAYGTMLAVAANNIANAATDGYTAARTILREEAGGGVSASVEKTGDVVDLSREALDLILAKTGFKAGVKVLQTGQEMEQTLLDLYA